MHNVNVKKTKDGFSLNIRTGISHRVVIGITTAQAKSLVAKLLKRLPPS